MLSFKFTVDGCKKQEWPDGNTDLDPCLSPFLLTVTPKLKSMSTVKTEDPEREEDRGIPMVSKMN